MRTTARALILALGLLGSGAAWAGGSWYVEGPECETKAQAAEQAKASGNADAKVIRRYRSGAGWRYLVRVEGFSAEGDARTAATALSTAISAPVELFAIEAGEAKQMGEVTPGAAPAAEAKDGAVVALVDRMIGQLGGPDGGVVAIAKASSVRFEFRRTLADGSVIRHVWSRRGADYDVQVIVEKGSATPSEMRIAGGKGWLSVNGGAMTEQNLERTKELVAELAPDGVIPFALTFAKDELPEELRDHGVRGSSDLPGCESVAHASDRAAAGVTIHVDDHTGEIRRVAFEDTSVVHELDGWKEVAPLVHVPTRIRTLRDGAVSDTVEVLALQLDADLPAASFAIPPQ